MNEFEFSSLTLYNFRITDETFNMLSQSYIQVMLDDLQVHGQIQMSKLIMAPNFKLAVRIPLTKTTVVQQKKKKLTEQEKKEQQMAKARGKRASISELTKKQEPEKVFTQVGYVDIEVNLQRGDTEEELERNYQLKLKH